MPADALPQPHNMGAPEDPPAALASPMFPVKQQEDPAPSAEPLVALPQPLATTPHGSVGASVAVAAPRATTRHAIPHHRAYRDALGRPMTGRVTFIGTQRATTGPVVVPAAPVTVALDEDGALDVQLPRDTYRVSALLRTVDGERVTDTDTVTL